jgi:hypothetical protein
MSLAELPTENQQPFTTPEESTRDNFIFDNQLNDRMADSMFMYAVTTGIFAFLVAILFASRGARKRHGPVEEVPESHSSGGGSEGEGRRVKKFRSDGTHVYD